MVNLGICCHGVESRWTGSFQHHPQQTENSFLTWMESIIHLTHCNAFTVIFICSPFQCCSFVLYVAVLCQLLASNIWTLLFGGLHCADLGGREDHDPQQKAKKGTNLSLPCFLTLAWPELDQSDGPAQSCEAVCRNLQQWRGSRGGSTSTRALNRLSGANMAGFWVVKVPLFSVNILRVFLRFPRIFFPTTQYFMHIYIFNNNIIEISFVCHAILTTGFWSM